MDDHTSAIEANESLRRFLRSSECQVKGDVCTVFAGLFLDKSGQELSFHMRPSDWTDEDVIAYCRAYQTAYTIPGAIQISKATFLRASLSVPFLQDDPDDHADYRRFHCSWSCPDMKQADAFADIVTKCIAGKSGARMVCNREKLKL